MKLATKFLQVPSGKRVEMEDYKLIYFCDMCWDRTCLFYSLSFIFIKDNIYIQPENHTTKIIQIEAVLSN